MGKLISITIALLIALVSTSAWAARRSFTIYNYTGYQITGVFTMSAGSHEWVAMGGDQIASRSSSSATFDPEERCNIKVKIETSGGEHEFARPFDFCTLTWIAIYYDNSTGHFSATEGFSQLFP